jgi:hypothetical protein
MSSTAMELGVGKQICSRVGTMLCSRISVLMMGMPRRAEVLAPFQ